ncbi:Cytochrome oxidase biogenesis protein Sco1/SenC/PrrC, thiol-disulfide reductase involved in Cu(I) insertion into CoxII Cu(A) center [hydrothermal vent metagenome]|uniref:Cytochrome oxidase biogenesis protein Sco1/SenC/PrrC, thiol-disulfide reductase involved in Cu(I) insertion into CoxII Cu(A) center n=1 Tax=hydrothermal vent metagenome TaxID=652676 RepID=A0A3B1AHF3_9ZZZZ
MAQIKKLHISLIIIIAIISAIAGSWFYSTLQNGSRQAELISIPPGLESIALNRAFPLSEFSLIDHQRKIFSEKSFKGKWSFVFFGFTNCPDVCPTTLTTMQQAWKNIDKKIKAENGKQDFPKQLILVTVDPNRDTPDVLKSYVEYYHSDFIGVTGPLIEITKLTKQLGVLYAYDNHGKTDGSYSVDHSAQIYLIDPNANLRAIFSAPHSADKISDNFISLTTYFNK